MKRRLPRLEWVVLAWVALTATGCMLLVNDGDYKVGADGGSGSSGTTTGSSGSATTGAATSGTSGNATSGATTGAATSGTSGNATSGATAGNATSGASTGELDAGGTRGDSSVPSMDASPNTDAALPPEAGAAIDSGLHPLDAGSQVCAVHATDSDCTACQKQSCCTAYGNCGADCQSILTCVSNCSAALTITAPCGCFDQFPAGVTQYLTLLSCQNANDCSCGFYDNGDPCVTSDTCEGFCGSSAPHSAAWCTPFNDCFSASDCVNFDTNSGDDIFGEVASCIDDTGTQTCFPGCDSVADCQAYPGTTCGPVTSVDGFTVNICHL